MGDHTTGTPASAGGTPAYEDGAAAADDSSLIDVLAEHQRRHTLKEIREAGGHTAWVAQQDQKRAAVEEFYEQNRNPNDLTVEQWEKKHGRRS